jgi:oxygen-dependent protoporphyrinogen oxidase
VRGGKPIRVPRSPLGFLSTPLFSARAKFGLLKEPFIGRSASSHEESVAEFVVRRLGQEFLDYAINPFVAGIYAGNPSRLSVRHAFPKLYALEKAHGSLMLGQFLDAREKRKRGKPSKRNTPTFSFDAGLQVLTDALQAKISDSVRLDTPVVGIEQTANHWTVIARSGGNEARSEHYAVVFSGPSHKLGKIRLSTTRSLDWSPLGEISYPPIASIVLGFRREDVSHPLDGFGMLIPEVESFSILGAIFSSSLFPNRAPRDHVTLSCYLGGTRASGLAFLEPDAAIDLAIKDLRALLGVRGQPAFRHHFLFPKAIPQYETGFGRFKVLMNTLEQNAPGLFLAGQYRDGISLGDSIVSGCNAAERIDRFLNGPSITLDCDGTKAVPNREGRLEEASFSPKT